MSKLFITSMARHANFDESSVGVQPVARDQWADGQFVVCEVTGAPNKLYRVELVSGRRPSVMPGDRVLGVLGRRAAALEFVGDWQAADIDGQMQCLTAAGLFGKLTSKSHLLPRPMDVRYVGHAVGRDGEISSIAQSVTVEKPAPLTIPTVQVVGTSMSAGKTTTARMIVRLLVDAGFKVAGVKMIGAGGHKDALAYQDAGAFFVRDFVDVGLPSTAGDAQTVRDGLGRLLGAVERSGADVFVAELGAAPHDPYHGQIALELLESSTVAQVLVASDAYAAFGYTKALVRTPDVVTGQAALTEAAREATTHLLPGVPVLDALEAADQTQIGAIVLQAVRDASATVGVSDRG